MAKKEMVAQEVKEVKGFKVKGVEVKRIGTKLVFEKDGEEVTLEQKLGTSDYSLVYLELMRKGSKRGTNGKHKVGNFSYEIIVDLIFIYNKAGHTLHSQELVTESDKKYPRLFVTNWLLNNLE